MIAIDSSAFIAYFSGEHSQVTEHVENALAANQVVVPPIVIVELLSDPYLPVGFDVSLAALPVLEPMPGYWSRAGKTRAILLRKKHKARLADTLIAQTCIDYRIPLLTLDKDFRSFAKYCGLVLVA